MARCEAAIDKCLTSHALQADDLLREAKQKYVSGDKMAALRYFEDVMKQVGDRVGP